MNKADLGDQVEFGPNEIQRIAKGHGADAILSSAKTGAGAEEAFHRLGAVVARNSLERAGEEDEE